MRQWHSLTSEAGDPTQLTSTWQPGGTTLKCRLGGTLAAVLEYQRQ